MNTRGWLHRFTAEAMGEAMGDAISRAIDALLPIAAVALVVCPIIFGIVIFLAALRILGWV